MPRDGKHLNIPSSYNNNNSSHNNNNYYYYCLLFYSVHSELVTRHHGQSQRILSLF